LRVKVAITILLFPLILSYIFYRFFFLPINAVVGLYLSIILSYILGRIVERYMFKSLLQLSDFPTSDNSSGVEDGTEDTIDLIYLLEWRNNDLYFTSVNNSFLLATGFSKIDVIDREVSGMLKGILSETVVT